MYQDSALDFSDYPILHVVLVLFAIGMTFGGFYELKVNRSIGGTLGIGFFAGILLLPFAAGLQVKYNEKRHNEAYVHNIMQKYNVDNVEVERSIFDLGAGVSTVTVGVDGKRYEFEATQNTETFEPTLIDMPIPGGSTPDATAVTADELIK